MHLAKLKPSATDLCLWAPQRRVDPSHQASTPPGESSGSHRSHQPSEPSRTSHAPRYLRFTAPVRNTGDLSLGSLGFLRFSPNFVPSNASQGQLSSSGSRHGNPVRGSGTSRGLERKTSPASVAKPAWYTVRMSLHDAPGKD